MPDITRLIGVISLMADREKNRSRRRRLRRLKLDLIVLSEAIKEANRA